MSEVINTAAFREVLANRDERVVFPENANVLLDAGFMDAGRIENLEDEARRSGRLVHRG